MHKAMPKVHSFLHKSMRKNSARREQNKINEFIFYAEAKPILSKFSELYDISVIPLPNLLLDKRFILKETRH